MNTRLQSISAIAGILLLPLLGLGLWYLLDQRPVIPPEGMPFAHEGNLIQNNPGLAEGVWYLSYEEPGSPGLSVQLRFDGASRCGSAGMLKVCDISFDQGQRVRVEGDQRGDVVLVRTITYLGAPAHDGTTIRLYYYNPDLDQGPGGVQCSAKGLVAVTRVIPTTATPLTDAIRLLLRGELSDDERERGLTTELPLQGLTLRSAAITNGVATLTFDDPRNTTVGGSCRVGILWQQIRATATQFPTVKDVRFMPEELFQP